jgi:2-polyprenyl-3-methyl-5-hydroxy-6-metoxy-1,4-benzoquinol methylase
MALVRAFEQRLREPEVMDDPALDSPRHIAALRGLARINFFSASVRIVWKPIARLARELGTDRLRVLDIATGAGDIPVRLWRKAQRAKLALDIHGVDISERALEFARSRAEDCGAEVRFSKFDVLADEIPADYDVVMCSLFLHHLDDEQALSLLRNMRSAARHLVLVNDLRRGRTGYWLAHLATRLFSTCDVVHIDGPLSVKAAFTIDEVRALAESAGLTQPIIQRRWPCRFLLQWRKP